MRSRAQTEHIEVRTHRRSALGPAAAAAAVAALALAIMLAVAAPGGPVEGPAAVASATPPASQTVAGATTTPVATAPQGVAPTAVAPPTALTYRSPLGYSVDLPAGWRRSDLQSRTEPDPQGDPELLAIDVFTNRTQKDERQAIADTHVGFGPMHEYTAWVRIQANRDGLAPKAYAEREQGAFGMVSVGVEEITFEGRPAAKTTWRYPPSGTRTSYAIYFQDAMRRMWVIGYYLAPDDIKAPTGATEDAVRGIVESFRSSAATAR